MSAGWIAFCIIMSYILLLCFIVYGYNKSTDMKELTTEQKAQRYDEALERTIRFLTIIGVSPNEEPVAAVKRMSEYIFPELEESEDEKIRKALIDGFKRYDDGSLFNGCLVREILAWFEKQGNKDMGISEATKKKLENNLNKALEKETPESCNEFLEKQCEQKPIYKVEPKFKVGDIITNVKIIGKVDENENNKYHGWFGYDKDLSVHYADIPDIENWHKWTIKDAKAGDVLATSAGAFIYNGNNGGGSCLGSYCGIDTLGGFKTGIEHHWTVKKVYPATKEQRDTLMKAMADEGYTFDLENKELKKNEEESENYKQQVMSEMTDLVKDYIIQKPAEWSEEDKYYYGIIQYCLNNESVGKADKENAISWFQSLKDRIQPKVELTQLDKNILEAAIAFVEKNHHFNCWRGVDKHTVLSALHSLRPQSTWKPSDEQMQALSNAGNSFRPFEKSHKVLWSLYNDLKKLMDDKG